VFLALVINYPKKAQHKTNEFCYKVKITFFIHVMEVQLSWKKAVAIG